MKSQKTKTIISIFFDTSNTPLENKLSSVESSSRKQQNIIYLYIECDSIRVPFVGNTINQAAFYNGTCFKNYMLVCDINPLTSTQRVNIVRALYRFHGRIRVHVIVLRSEQFAT